MLESKHWVEVTKDSDIDFDGTDIAIEWANGNVSSITFTDWGNDSIKIMKGDYGGFKVLVPEKKKVYELSGTVCGQMIENEQFDELHDAEAKMEEFGSLGDKVALEIQELLVAV